MTAKPQSTGFVRFIKSIWKTLNGFRILVLNLVFFSLLLMIIAASIDDGAVVLKGNTALVLNPVGQVVEQYSTDPSERALNQAMDEEVPETRMRDLLRAIEAARSDDDISHLVINPDGMWGIGLSKLQELRRAIHRFRESGKPVIAYSHGMGQDQYYLASLADEIWMHPEGLVFLEGFSVYRNYYREGLDKLDVNVHLFKVGEYKSAAEPFVRDDMSEASREANRYWLEGLWEAYLADVSAERDTTPEELEANVNEFGERLELNGGDPAATALEYGLVDRIAGRDEFRQAMIERTAYDEDFDTFRQIGLERYIKALNRRVHALAKNKVAVIVAQGAIVGGDQPTGMVGGETVTRLIREARADEDVSAIVLRIDSPGGAVLPSEMIRREIEVSRQAGIPVIASMSTVAASGGYWIAMSADQIWANPTTITGSIGIFGMITTFPGTLDKIGVHTDGIGTTELAGALRADRPLSDRVAGIIQTIIEDGYEKFINKVSDARGMPPEQVDRVARGRVWSGEQAYDRGLVDELGGLDQAIGAAAELAGLGEDYAVRYVEPEPTPFEQFLLDLTASVPGVLSPAGPRSWLQALLDQPVPDELELLLSQREGRLGIYAHCLCGPRY